MTYHVADLGRAAGKDEGDVVAAARFNIVRVH